MNTRILKEDWEFNVLGVYNYRKPGELRYYFDYVAENHDRISGDLLEAGVFRGRSLLGMGLMLKELGSSKVLYGYDTWSGFPPIYHEMDNYSQWARLRAEGIVSEAHYQRVLLNQDYRRFALKKTGGEISAANASLSGDFSGCSVEDLQRKLDFLGLDNVKLVKGPFDQTMTAQAALTQRLMAVLIDADLYLSYKVCLPFVWPCLSRGGYIFLDEYYSLKFPGARIATDEFLSTKKDKPQRHVQIAGDFERWYVRKLYD